MLPCPRRPCSLGCAGFLPLLLAPKPGFWLVVVPPPLALQPGMTCSGLPPLALEPALHGVWIPLLAQSAQLVYPHRWPWGPGMRKFAAHPVTPAVQACAAFMPRPLALKPCVGLLPCNPRRPRRPGVLRFCAAPVGPGTSSASTPGPGPWPDPCSCMAPSGPGCRPHYGAPSLALQLLSCQPPYAPPPRMLVLVPWRPLPTSDWWDLLLLRLFRWFTGTRIALPPHDDRVA